MKGVPGLQWTPTKTYGAATMVDLQGWSSVVGRQDPVPASPEEFSLTPGSTPDPVPADESPVGGESDPGSIEPQ